jgi:pimeloyl-ACP methyl ester carboxylesterase
VKLFRAPLALVATLTWLFASAPASVSHVIRGRPQHLWLYGDARQAPVIVSSGDGGWIHLAPHVAELLASHGFYVVGFDAKAYLDSFTDRGHTLNVADVPADYATLVSLVSKDRTRRPVLIGVSEGAGLSVLAAAAERVKPRIAGVIAVGLGDRNELGWKWTDSVIYLTKGVPDEPTFSAVDVIRLLPPTPVALLWSSRDEYVAPAETVRLAEQARDPKRVWTVPAGDHRFSDNLAGFDARLLEAMQWIRSHSEP